MNLTQTEAATAQRLPEIVRARLVSELARLATGEPLSMRAELDHARAEIFATYISAADQADRAADEARTSTGLRTTAPHAGEQAAEQARARAWQTFLERRADPLAIARDDRTPPDPLASLIRHLDGQPAIETLNAIAAFVRTLPPPEPARRYRIYANSAGLYHVLAALPGARLCTAPASPTYRFDVLAAELRVSCLDIEATIVIDVPPTQTQEAAS